ncbi:rubredoxin [Paraburkholderia tropica]|uniref:rubredoxin n=1 Tax=Paraburkholderia tropica TaxID=92647 RepID=UPI0016123D50|nr:rubredoxin [Paraburkholderia tropica]MBB2998698.1 rubredoxin [Paraburkholderia tropica]MBB6318527.1 rubredoxin [Paraburkholderia tropica]
MYKKGVALEIQFSPDRLNDGAGDPYWIDFTAEEAAALLETLQTRLANRESTSAPLVVALDTPRVDAQAEAAQDTNAPKAAQAADDGFKQWVCVICGWVYDEALGAPDDGLAPGTRWADVPDDWRCPLCDVGKEDFALVEF